MSFDSFPRYPGPKSAVYAAVRQNSQGNNVTNKLNLEVDYHRINSLADIRILNYPDLDNGDGVSDDIQSDADSYPLSKSNEGYGKSYVSEEKKSSYEEMRSEEYAILSISSSVTSADNEVGPRVSPTNRNNVHLHTTNSQRIDDWCMNNELSLLVEENEKTYPCHESNRLKMHDAIFSWNSNLDMSLLDKLSNAYTNDTSLIEKIQRKCHYGLEVLETLNFNQLNATKRFIRELLPFLRNSRRGNMSTCYQTRYNDIPSVLPQREIIIACSLKLDGWSKNYDYNDTFNTFHTLTSSDQLLSYHSGQDLTSVDIDEIEPSVSLRTNSWVRWALLPIITDNDF